MQATTRFDGPSVLDRPVGGWVDQPSRRTVAWRDGPARTPLTLLFVAYTTFTLVVAGIGVAIVHAGPLAGLRAWDVDVSRWFVEHRTPTLDEVTVLVSNLADTIAVIGLAVLVGALLAWRRRWRDVLLLAAGLGLEASVFITANALVRRPRPPVETVGHAPTTFSFPSGHTAATIVLWGCFALLLSSRIRSRALRALIWCVPALMGFAVAFSRVYRGMHFLTDVLVGAALGVAALFVAAVAARSSALADADTREVAR